MKLNKLIILVLAFSLVFLAKAPLFAQDDDEEQNAQMEEILRSTWKERKEKSQ